MSTKGNWRPMLIVGLVLSINGFIFLAVSWSSQTNYFTGIGLGSAGAGVALSAIGYVLFLKAKGAEREGP